MYTWNLDIYWYSALYMDMNLLNINVRMIKKCVILYIFALSKFLPIWVELLTVLPGQVFPISETGNFDAISGTLWFTSIVTMWKIKTKIVKQNSDIKNNHSPHSTSCATHLLPQLHGLCHCYPPQRWDPVYSESSASKVVESVIQHRKHIS